MSSLGDAIRHVRESVVAVMAVTEVRREGKPGKHGKKPLETIEYRLGFGSGFCVTTDKYVVTAHHVLNDGRTPDPKTRFYVFTVPDNGEQAYHFPVTAVPVQRQDLDIAVLEVGACASPEVHIPALEVTFQPFTDGQPVVTVGFPAPEVHGLNIDPSGEYQGGQFFLKSHANEGIVSAHYDLGSLPVYELNVTWHNGESGGPIVALGGSTAAFSLMQQYRNVQTPHGVVPGPRRGLALASAQSELKALGISSVTF